MDTSAGPSEAHPAHGVRTHSLTASRAWRRARLEEGLWPLFTLCWPLFAFQFGPAASVNLGPDGCVYNPPDGYAYL